jgi:hypothetical protein
MKTKIAIAASVIGVLGAGSAAALVNTQILEGDTASGASSAVLPPASTVDVTVPTPTVASTVAPTSTTDPTTTAPSTTSSTTTEPDAALTTSGFLTAFNVGDAGVVTVDVLRGRLVLVSAEPADGWRVTKREDSEDDDGDDNEVEVYFESATIRVEFEASLIDGKIVPKVESERIGGSAPSRPASPPPTTTGVAPATPDTVPATTVGGDHHDDDHDDDDHGDEDHDDEDHDDDDHDEDHDDDDHDDDDHDDEDHDDEDHGERDDD